MIGMLRTVSAHVGRRVYAGDLAAVSALVRCYWHPAPPPPKRVPSLTVTDTLHRLRDVIDVPFVYESQAAPHLRRLRDAFNLPSLVTGGATEYENMLNVGTWLGSRWDHGNDALPGGTQEMDVVDVIRQGLRGKRYWCEVASKVAVQTFTAMGWVARLASTSSDGRAWEHSVADVWSNQFAKWFAIDTDFNVVYECDGVPLSAYELCHDGPALQRSGRLYGRLLGAPKPSLPLIDLLPLYGYVSIDLRSDWYTRKLRRASPAGGDLASWWTARRAFMRSLAPKVRVDARERFDWPVNIGWLRPRNVTPLRNVDAIRVLPLAYSPVFNRFQLSVDGGDWRDADGEEVELRLSPGPHVLSARIITANGGVGMITEATVDHPSQEAASVNHH